MHCRNMMLSLIILMQLFNIVTQISYATPAKHPNEHAIEQAILIHINEYRTKRGLSLLKMNEQMAREATKHSQDMANHKIPFGHQKFMERMNRLHKAIKHSGAGAENVAYNYKNAQDVVSNWLKSPGHKRNIDGNYDITGIGVVRDSKGKLYFTQLFLKTGTSKSKSLTKKAAPQLFISPFFSRHA